ncbi:MAG: SEL1-like repeat protein [Alphaproteobacteria bacterium]|nr:SEL1-like repeat protein [Alphaproteobacteria bacterium]
MRGIEIPIGARHVTRAMLHCLLTKLLLTVAVVASPASPARAADDGIYGEPHALLAQADASPQTAAIRQMKELAEQGNPAAQLQVSAWYSSGFNFPKDDREAVNWLKRSAAQNYAPSLSVLGLRYETGRGVPQDRAEAVRLFRLAAARGNKIAAIHLERFGEPVPPATINDPVNAPDKRVSSLVMQATGAPSMAAAASGPMVGGGGAFMIPLRSVAGVLTVPVLLNGSVSATFVLDSGAAGVTVPETLIDALRKAGKLSDADMGGSVRHVLANGSTSTDRAFVLRSVQVGPTTATNVQASTAPAKAPPLLGQTFLRQFASWSIDNQSQMLVLRAR